jgi:hypothetical protein
MDARIWRRIARAIHSETPKHRSFHKHFPDPVVAQVYLWAVLHDRPVDWACSAGNWRGYPHPALPSQPTMSRRLRTVGVCQFLEQVRLNLREHFPQRKLKFLDSRPILVGGASTDRDAKAGRAARGKARGYRIHCLWDVAGAPDLFCLAPMSTNDKVPAVSLIPTARGAWYLGGDNQYDANGLYDLSGENGIQLLVAPRHKTPQGLGHHYQSPLRLKSLELTANPLKPCGVTCSFGQDLVGQRTMIERAFGSWSSFGGGQGCYIPAWVRRPHRVALWVEGKLIILLARMSERQAVKEKKTADASAGCPKPPPEPSPGIFGRFLPALPAPEMVCGPAQAA